MDERTIDAVIRALEYKGIKALDITGGAPELNPHLRKLILASRKRGIHVMLRTNLAVLREPYCKGLPDFFAHNQVELIGSLPCYMEDNVDAVRGRGTFSKCVESLRALNGIGYAKDNSLILNLVYNPIAASLPPNQAALEGDYRRELSIRYGITFNHLYAFGNMPIGRFGSALDDSHRVEYINLLSSTFNRETLGGLMCRSLISVGWDGKLSDCDFNQALGLPLRDAPSSIEEFAPEAIALRRIAISEHCWTCTAGTGFTCSGSIK